jgi:cytochrome c
MSKPRAAPPAPLARQRLAGLAAVMALGSLAASSLSAWAGDASLAPQLGQALGPEQLARLRPAIYPDGAGLPRGQGSAEAGARLYQAQCAACHGRRGEGATAPELIGGEGPLAAPDADKTLKTYWPYATTLYDTIARSMPPTAPGRLTPEELYGLCAWLLAENGLWSHDRLLDGPGLAAIRMPNREGFLRDAAAPAR